MRGEGILLRRQLTRHFGPLPQDVLDRFARIDFRQQQPWADRLIDATSLDDVFAED